MEVNSRPPVRYSERDFALAFVRKNFTFKGQPVIGFIVELHIGKRFSTDLSLTACSSDWTRICKTYINDCKSLLVIAEVFYGIKQHEWIGCHPERGQKLYSSKRSPAEKCHRMFLKKFDITRRGSLSYAEIYRSLSADFTLAPQQFVQADVASRLHNLR